MISELIEFQLGCPACQREQFDSIRGATVSSQLLLIWIELFSGFSFPRCKPSGYLLVPSLLCIHSLFYVIIMHMHSQFCYQFCNKLRFAFGFNLLLFLSHICWMKEGGFRFFVEFLLSREINRICVLTLTPPLYPLERKIKHNLRQIELATRTFHHVPYSCVVKFDGWFSLWS